MKFELDNLVSEYETLETELADPTVYGDPSRLRDIMRRKKSLETAVTLYRDYKRLHSDLDEVHRILAEESDHDLIAMAKEELVTTEARIITIEEELKLALIPRDPNDDRNIILEVRAGTGGEEAMLFARELAEAYIAFAEELGYRIEPMDVSEGDAGGYREYVAKIVGAGAYSRFKFEAGTHRVQRIPATENK